MLQTLFEAMRTGGVYGSDVYCGSTHVASPLTNEYVRPAASSKPNNKPLWRQDGPQSRPEV